MTPISVEADVPINDGVARGVRYLTFSGMLVAGVLVLSACGGSPEEGAQVGANESSGTASASPSASDRSNRGPAEEAPDTGPGSREAGDERVPASSEGPAKNVPLPERPPLMSQETADGAEAAVKYWFELFEYARLSGDTEPLRAMSRDGCTKCADDLDNIDAVYDVGGWYADVEYAVDGAEFSVRNGRADGIVRVSSPGFRSYEADGTEHESDGMDGSLFQMELTFAGDQWLVSDWGSVRTSS